VTLNIPLGRPSTTGSGSVSPSSYSADLPRPLAVYKARELIHTGREDICDEVMTGRLKMHAALKLAKPEKYGSGRNYRPGDDH
jgi:hypothetical protein